MNLANFKLDKLGAINDFCASYGLHPGDDCSIVLRSYRWVNSPTKIIREYTVEVDIFDLAAMAIHQRLKLKRDYKLEVPTYMIGTESPPLNCRTSFGDDECTAYLELMVHGAYVCVAKGTEEVEPPEYRKVEASKLDAMTPEEALAYVRAKAQEARKPITRNTYSCRPVGSPA